MKLAVRLDHSPYIGLGHLKRCLEIALKLKSFNVQVHFICRKHLNSDYSFILDKGFPLHELEEVQLDEEQISNSSNWLGVSQFKDSQETLKFLDSLNFDAVLVDHYGINIEWERFIRNEYKLICMDDINRKHDADMLIDYSFWKKEASLNKLVNSECKVLVGKEFTPIHKDFEQKQNKKMNLNNPNLLISLGGSDNENLLEPIIESISSARKLFNNLLIVISKADRYKLRDILEANRIEANVHIAPFGLNNIYLQADLCIGSSGISAIERCLVNIPSLLIVKAENQVDLSRYLKSKFLASTIHKDEDISKKVREFLLDRELHLKIFKKLK